MNTNKNFERHGNYKPYDEHEGINELVEGDELEGKELLWEITDETIEFAGRTLHRIKALKDYEFSGISWLYCVEKDKLGGYIEKEKNLDQKSWVADNAIVMDDARVRHSSVVKDNAIVMDNAFVSSKSLIKEDGIFKGNAAIHGSIIGGNVCVRDYADIESGTKIGGNVEVFGKSIISGKCDIDGILEIYDNAYLYNCIIKGYGYRIGKDAYIKNIQDICSFNNFGSRADVLTAYRTQNNSVRINVGCFHGDIIEFRKRVAKEKAKDSIIRKEYELIADIIQVRFIDHDTSEYFGNNKCDDYEELKTENVAE